jgi:hypothetical protein
MAMKKFIIAMTIAILFSWLIGLLMGCTQKPWLSPPQNGWKHVSNQYYNGLSDEWECTWLDFAKPTQKSIIKPLRMSRDSFVSYDDCMRKKGYYK